MSLAFLSFPKDCAISPTPGMTRQAALRERMAKHCSNQSTGHAGHFMSAGGLAGVALVSLSARRRRNRGGHRAAVPPQTTKHLGASASKLPSRKVARTVGAFGRALRAATGVLPEGLRRAAAGMTRTMVAAHTQEAAVDEKPMEYAELFSYASRMVKIFLALTFVPFLFCVKNFFFDPRLSDFNVEYGPHLASSTLRATSLIQAIMIALAIGWRQKNKDSKIDLLFAWLFVPEGFAHILLHYLNHIDSWIGNLAFGYAFSAGIALPGFLSIMVYCPRNKLLPWLYMILYVATQIPICSGLTDMVGPAKMRLNFANLNTATITGPFFYGILKRWNDIPKLPVFLACATITYQVTMGIIGPINSGVALKLYDSSVVFQHAVVDVGFGISYAASIYYGLFRPDKEWNRKA